MSHRLCPGDGDDAGELGSLLATGQPRALERHAAELAAASPEFSPSSLGGQDRGGRAVYVLADAHGLLQHTLVLKRVPRDVALGEEATTVRFGEYLKRTGAPRAWSVPTSLGVIDHPTDAKSAVYVMRRAQGTTLGQMLLDEPEAARALLPDAVRFLAAFCAWAAAESSTPLTLTAKRPKKLGDALFARGRRLGLSLSTANRVAKGLRALVEGDEIAVAKRDAHAKNWMVTDAREIVALDLETTITVPVLYEVAQLVDDYPFITVDDEGWSQRLALCRLHLDELGARGAAMSLHDEEVERRLSWFAFAHAMANLGRLGEHPDDRRVSTSGREERRQRRAHVLALVGYIAEHAQDEGLRYAAAQLHERASAT
jgi:hypothetical protein